MKLDPDSLRDEPLQEDTTQAHPDDLTDLQKQIARVKGMLVDTNWEYAEGTLRSMLRFMENKQICTPAMRGAIDNIEAKPSCNTRHGGW